MQVSARLLGNMVEEREREDECGKERKERESVKVRRDSFVRNERTNDVCTSKHRSTDDDESDNQSSVKQRTSFLWLAIDDDNNDDGLCNGNKTEQLFGQKNLPICSQSVIVNLCLFSGPAWPTTFCKYISLIGAIGVANLSERIPVITAATKVKQEK